MKFKKTKKIEIIYPIFILIATLFLSIGYAQISGVVLTIDATADAEPPKAVYITNVQHKSNVDADTVNSVINYYTGTMVDTTVVLGNNSNSSITYEITMYNNTDKEYVFIQSIVDKEEESLYSNPNITFSLNIEEGKTTIAPQETLTFEITYTYIGTDISNNTLDNKINFRFREKPIINLSNEGETYTIEELEPGSTEEYEFTVTNYNEGETKINGVPLTYTFETEITGETEENPITAKIYDENGNEITDAITLEGDGTTKTSKKYTLKITWEEDNISKEYFGQEYTCKIKVTATPEDESYKAYKEEKEFKIEITTTKSYKVYLTSLSGTTSYFKESTYRTKITNISFVNYVDTSQAVKTYDLSEKKDGSITGWIIDTNGDGTAYELYIGSEFDIYAKTLASAFYEMTGVTNITFENLNTSETTNMSNMFYNCSKLTSLDLSSFDTSKVTNMAYMFSKCSSLTRLDLSSFDTSNVTSMYQMFYYCSSLTSLDVSSFDTSKVTNMAYMFKYCRGLATLDVSNFNTSRVLTMGSMFYCCDRLKELDLSNFDTSKVTNMSDMFNCCDRLTELNVSNFDTSEVKNMHGMFYYCKKLMRLDVCNFDTSNVTDMSFMFYYCSTLTELDLSNFDTSKVTNMGYMFWYCSSLTSLDMRNASFDSVTSYTGMFSSVPSGIGIIVKDEDAKTWIEARLTDVSISGTVTIAE